MSAAARRNPHGWRSFEAFAVERVERRLGRELRLPGPAALSAEELRAFHREFWADDFLAFRARMLERYGQRLRPALVGGRRILWPLRVAA